MPTTATPDSLSPAPDRPGAEPPPGRRPSRPAAAGDPAAALSASLTFSRQRLARACDDAGRRQDAAARLAECVAHDINNVLAAVIGNLQLLARRAGDDPALNRLIEPAIAAALRGGDMADRLHAYAHRLEPAPAPVDVNAVVAALEAPLRRTMGPAITVTSTLAADVPPAVADATLLEAAILCLAVNARDAMPDGGSLAVETSRAAVDGDADGVYACVSVADSGRGMAPEIVDRAFEPFFSTMPANRRCGLGLSMVAGFVQRSNGHLAVTSAPGEGTRIGIFLPADAGGGRR